MHISTCIPTACACARHMDWPRMQPRCAMNLNEYHDLHNPWPTTPGCNQDVRFSRCCMQNARMRSGCRARPGALHPRFNAASKPVAEKIMKQMHRLAFCQCCVRAASKAPPCRFGCGKCKFGCRAPASSSNQKPCPCEFAATLLRQIFFGDAVQNDAAWQSESKEKGEIFVPTARLPSKVTYSSSPSSTK